MAILSDRVEMTDIADGDLFFTTDVSDTTDAPTGTDKRNPWSNIKAKLKTYFDTLYSGPVTTIVGITGTKAQFDTACSDGNFLYVGDAPTISSGAGAPASTPSKVGDIYIDTTADDAYIAVGTASSSDWEKSNDGAGGGISDGDKGDITVSASGAIWTIDNGVVTLAKQADMATASVVYRKTAGAGAPEVQTLATLKTDLGLTGTNSGDQTSIGGITGTKAQFDTAVTDGNFLYVGDVTSNATHTGDVTGSTALTIANDAVTYAKMQNVSATDKVLGRVTAGAGDVEEISTTGSGNVVRATSPTLVTPTLGTPASGTLTNCTGLPLAGVVDSTSEALGVGTIELGHASDTTISRVSAGVAAIEGVNIVTTALTGSTTQAGIAEASIASEVNTGTDAARYVSPDSLAGSNFGIRYAQVTLNGTTALTTSEKAYFRIPAGLTGMNLVSVTGTVGTGAAGSSSSGTPTFTVKNVTDGNQMLSTSLTIDAGEYTSATAAAAVAINGSFDDVVTDDLIEVAVTTAGTGVTYAQIVMGFQLP